MSATWPVLRASCVTQSRVTLDPVAGGGTWGPVGCSQFAAVCSLIPRLGPVAPTSQWNQCTCF